MTERTTTARPLERYFASYSDDHRNATNQQIHVLAVPAILWSVVALLWCIPVGGTGSAAACGRRWQCSGRGHITTGCRGRLAWACWRSFSFSAVCAG